MSSSTSTCSAGPPASSGTTLWRRWHRMSWPSRRSFQASPCQRPADSIASASSPVCPEMSSSSDSGCPSTCRSSWPVMRVNAALIDRKRRSRSSSATASLMVCSTSLAMRRRAVSAACSTMRALPASCDGAPWSSRATSRPSTCSQVHASSPGSRMRWREPKFSASPCRYSSRRRTRPGRSSLCTGGMRQVSTGNRAPSTASSPCGRMRSSRFRFRS